MDIGPLRLGSNLGVDNPGGNFVLIAVAYWHDAHSQCRSVNLVVR